MRLLVCVLMVVAGGLARAQTPPQGNTHPEVPLLMETGEGVVNPFGPARWEPAGDGAIARKRALARGVDLDPLRDLAVQHGGRVQIMDTLARETVRRLTGRSAFREEAGLGGAGDRFAYDPLFTLLDLMIDPGYYYDQPLVHINFFHLRRAFVERAVPGNADAQDRWLKSGRVSPAMIRAHWEEIADAYDVQEDYRRALADLARSVSLIDGGWRNLLVVAPPGRDQPWAHLSELPEEAPARRAARALGDAWRAGDAAGVNEQVRVLAAELPRIHPDVYPTTRRGVEMAYNRLGAFDWGAWAYLVALVALVLAAGTGRRWVVGVGVGLLAGAIALHAVGFGMRCYLAQRFAIQNQFESMTGVSLFAAVVGAAIMLWRRQWLFGAAAAAVGFMVLLTATQTAIPGRTIDREAAILNTSVLLKYHVTTVLTSYGLIALGMVLSVFYLGVAYLSRGKEGGNARTLLDLDKAQMIVLQLAFWTLAVGILLGAWWADHSWGRWWAFDPKETFALVTWIIYLIVIHVRVVLTGRRRGLVTAWLSVAGFVAMLWCYFGVNLLLPGLHAYA